MLSFVVDRHTSAGVSISQDIMYSCVDSLTLEGGDALKKNREGQTPAMMAV